MTDERRSDESGPASIAARDDLAGVVDLFGALTRDELCDALSELAFKRGKEADEPSLDAAIGCALREYYLVPVSEGVEIPASEEAERDAPDGAEGAVPSDALLAVGPAAFPSVPPNAEDLPYILDVSTRDVDRERLGETVHARVAAEAETAADNDARARLETLLEVTYDLEAWAPVDASGVRERIHEALDG